MGDKSSDLVQGTLDMLVLKTLALEPMHGYGISVRIEQMSKGVFRLNAGSLFLAIQRLYGRRCRSAMPKKSFISCAAAPPLNDRTWALSVK
ncbi:MAG: hypothetical protein DMG40_00400 [Acidobacteria bacterium]|nr:MAG: hypothetical protein DMG40_00400 [Acidobacteriota bacterium]